MGSHGERRGLPAKAALGNGPVGGDCPARREQRPPVLPQPRSEGPGSTGRSGPFAGTSLPTCPSLLCARVLSRVARTLSPLLLNKPPGTCSWIYRGRAECYPESVNIFKRKTKDNVFSVKLPIKRNVWLKLFTPPIGPEGSVWDGPPPSSTNNVPSPINPDFPLPRLGGSDMRFHSCDIFLFF